VKIAILTAGHEKRRSELQSKPLVAGCEAVGGKTAALDACVFNNNTTHPTSSSESTPHHLTLPQATAFKHAHATAFKHAHATAFKHAHATAFKHAHATAFKHAHATAFKHALLKVHATCLSLPNQRQHLADHVPLEVNCEPLDRVEPLRMLRKRHPLDLVPTTLARVPARTAIPGPESAPAQSPKKKRHKTKTELELEQEVRQGENILARSRQILCHV
jgi:hypothetical protein